MKLICATAALAALMVSPVYADCVAPVSPPSVPDGNTATLHDMLTAKNALTAYNTATNEYLACLDKDLIAAVKAAGPKVSKTDRAKLVVNEAAKHNAAVDQLNKVAGDFNEQVRLFKAKYASAKGSASQG